MTLLNRCRMFTDWETANGKQGENSGVVPSYGRLWTPLCRRRFSGSSVRSVMFCGWFQAGV